MGAQVAMVLVIKAAAIIVRGAVSTQASIGFKTPMALPASSATASFVGTRVGVGDLQSVGASMHRAAFRDGFIAGAVVKLGFRGIT